MKEKNDDENHILKGSSGCCIEDMRSLTLEGNEIFCVCVWTKVTLDKSLITKKNKTLKFWEPGQETLVQPLKVLDTILNIIPVL